LSDGAAAPPSRWLLIVTLGVVALFTILRLAIAASLDLRSDEAYYWTWSHQPVLSFLDQPPMVAWFERFGIALFGDTPLGARFAQLVAFPLIQMILADIARRRTKNWDAALFVVLALECALNYGFFAIVVEPSTPLLLFVSVMLWALVQLDETAEPRWWLLAGVAGGLALLSKYIVLLLAPALLVFLLLEPRHRRWLTSPWPYAAIAIALLLFSPVIIWNVRHDWASFAFQSIRLGTGHGAGVGDLVSFGLYETLWVGPVLLVSSLAGALALLTRGIRLRRSFDAAVAIAFLFPLAFLLVRSLTLHINQSWAWFVWPFGILALSLVLPWQSARRRAGLLVGVVATTGLPLVAAFFYHALLDRSVWLGRGDPFGQDAGYGEMANAVLADARVQGAAWIATTDYRTYANLLWHIGDKIPIAQINERSRFLDFALPDPTAFSGKALYVHQGQVNSLLGGARVTPVEALPVSWRGVEMQTITVDLVEGFVPDLSPAPGAPAYAWSN
jgi:4-amino-4-deoxy-L-arabinose transferase-like glycosyltransferase